MLIRLDLSPGGVALGDVRDQSTARRQQTGAHEGQVIDHGLTVVDTDQCRERMVVNEIGDTAQVALAERGRCVHGRMVRP